MSESAIHASRLQPWTGLWRLADPKVSLASFSAMFLGACAVATTGPLNPWTFLLTVLGIFAIEIAKNASGEIVDFDTGADQAVLPEDRSPFSGGKRVLVDGLLTRQQTILISAITYTIGIGIGLYLALIQAPAIFWLGWAGVGLAYFYHAPPLRLAYRGLGELAVGICYGPLITLGTWMVQRGSVDSRVFWVSIPLGSLTAAFLIANEFPDSRADAQAGKRTWVVRLGRQHAVYLFIGVELAALMVTAFLPALGLPFAVWLALPAFIPALRAAHQLHKHADDTQLVIPAQADALKAFVAYSVLAGTGLLLTH